ncbi:alanine/glycine:cation symporter family protein [Dysosmobacter welbionis]
MMNLIAAINDFCWGAPQSILLIVFGLFLTIYFKNPFIKYFSYIKEGLLAKKKDKQGISGFASLCVALGNQVGAGNISGVATAIALGGPGALFWMWVTALVGMASALCETVAGQIFKGKNVLDGTDVGGAPYYIEKGMGLTWLATLYACTHVAVKAFSSLMVQANTLITNFSNIGGVEIDPLVIGIVVAVIVGAIGFGGAHRVADASKLIVPFMSLFYVIVSIVIIIMNIDRVGAVFVLIFRSAFTPQAATGGIFGAGVRAAFQQGVRRGLYSNNAGQGAIPYSMARASVSHPATQGFSAMLSVVIDTLVICTCTGLMILLSSDAVLQSGETAITLARLAIGDHLGVFGQAFLSISLFLFVLTGILGAFFCGETDVIWLCRNKVHLTKGAITVFRMVICISIVLGSQFNPTDVFEIADFFNIITLTANFFALAMLHKVSRDCVEDYDRQRKAGVDNPQWDWSFADRYQQERLSKSHHSKK